MIHRTTQSCFVALLSLFSTVVVSAQETEEAPATPPANDVVLLQNGDRITGQILTMVDGSLTIKTSYAGELKIAMSAVQTFSSGGKLAIVLNDGSTVQAQASEADAGSVTIKSDTVPIGDPIPIASVTAINPAEKEPVKWTGSVAASFIAARGNAYTDQSNFRGQAVRRGEDDRTTVITGYASSRFRDNQGEWQTSERRVYGNLKYDYFFAEDWFTYVALAGEKDGAKSLDLRFNAGAGVGYQIAEEDDLKAYVEAGLAWFYENYATRSVPVGQDTSNSTVAARVAWDLQWDMTEDLRLVHNAWWLPGLEHQDDHLVQTNTALRYALDKNLFVQAGVFWEWDNTPAPGFKRVDTRYTLSVGLSF